jgi:hypothetical protein
MRFEREEVIQILERQNCSVEILDSGSVPSPRVFSKNDNGNWPECDPQEALRLLRSHPQRRCIGRGTRDGITLITIMSHPDINAARRTDERSRVPQKSKHKSKNGLIGILRQIQTTVQGAEQFSDRLAQVNSMKAGSQ